METKELHFNKPQLRSMMILAPSETAIMGRGTGKTVGILAPKSAQCYFKTMPRGTGVVINRTFTQAYSRTLRELKRGWQNLGYKEDHHFIVGKRPSDKWKKLWNWKTPYACPDDFKHVISWSNGAVAQLLTQEGAGNSNGLSIDWIIGDEAKLLDQKKFETELLPANRGFIPAFRDNIYHHGITLTTDMPVGTGGRWLLNQVEIMDKAAINQIWELQAVRFELVNILIPKSNKAQEAEIRKQVAVIDAEMMDLRKGLLYYHEGSTIDNIHALGLEYLKDQLRRSSQFLIDTQILNIRPLRLEDGFYPDLDEEVHGYFAEDDSYFANRTIDPDDPQFDSRKDADINPNAALHCALDYNRRIHPMVVGQVDGFEIKAKKGLHSLYPGKLHAVLHLFIDYFKHHKKKVLYYWYDHTAVGGENDTEKYLEVQRVLSAAGWVVIPMYIGKAPGHETKYNMWGHLLSEDKHYPYTFRVNRENCSHLILSMGLAEAEQRKDGFGKDKKSEHDINFPAEESTHYSDAADQWVYGVLESGLSFDRDSAPGESIITR